MVALLGLASAGVRAELPSCDWPMYGRDPGRSFAAPWNCSDITPLNAVTLIPKWHIYTGSPVTASPSVVDGVVYVGSNAGTLYAIDAETGDINWTFEVTDGNQNYVGKIIGSVAVTEVEGTRIVILPGGSTIYLLDAEDGKKLASLCTDPRSHEAPRCEGSSFDIDVLSSPAPVTVDGEPWVFVGHDVHNRPNVGRTGILAMRIGTDPWSLDAIWKADPEAQLSYTTDPSKDGVEGFVYTDDPLTYGHGTGDGCGGVWGSPAVDVEGGRVFFGTSNCTRPDEMGITSGEATYGIDLRTGKFLWRYNPRIDRDEHFRYDDDFGASPNLLPLGRVGFGGKDGWYYGLRRDRPNADEILEGEWASRPGQSGRLNSHFSIGGMIGTPAVGEVFGEPAIFATTAISTPFPEPINEDPRIDETLLEDPGRMFSIHAFSAIDGRLLWRSPLSRQSYGAPTFARGVVFVPSTVDFAVNVFHADTGVLLRRLPLEGAPSSAPAIVGDSIYVGSQTSASPGPPFIDIIAGIWAFRLA